MDEGETRQLAHMWGLVAEKDAIVRILSGRWFPILHGHVRREAAEEAEESGEGAEGD
jgi:hypothetical protein